MLGSGRHSAEFFSAMWDTISKNGTWEGDIWNRRKNGDDFPAHLIITAIKDSDGSVINYVGTFSDVTECMKFDARLYDAHQRMASLPNSMAESIETAAQYQMLLDMGCELGQGYAIAHPMPAGEIAKWRATGGKPESRCSRIRGIGACPCESAR